MEVNRPKGEKSKSNKIITIWTKESILEKIDKIHPAGNTCLAVGLSYAISNFDTKSVKKILLLTDGNQDCSSIEDCESIVRAAKEKKYRHLYNNFR